MAGRQQVATAIVGGAAGDTMSDLRGSADRLLNVQFVGGATPPTPEPEPEPDPAAGTPQTGAADGSVARGRRVDYNPSAVTPGTAFEAAMTGSGDADLYVSFGTRAGLVTRPTLTTHLCAP